MQIVENILTFYFYRWKCNILILEGTNDFMSNIYNSIDNFDECTSNFYPI